MNPEQSHKKQVIEDNETEHDMKLLGGQRRRKLVKNQDIPYQK